MKNRKWWLLASLIILILVVGWLIVLEDAIEIEKEQQAQYSPPVSIIEIQPGSHKGLIQTYAEIKPHWEATIKSQVNGKIVRIDKKAFAGESINKGDVLIRIEDSAYRANLDEAKQVLAEAELNLLQEQKKSAQAQRDWQRSGLSNPPSDLVLNKPQKKVAENKVNAAKSHLNAARVKHTYTRIKAPFSGVITQRHVSIGQTIAEGEELLHIVGNTQQDLTVSLNPQQWNMLAEKWQGQMASIRNMAGVEITRAENKRGGGFLDKETHQYKLFLEVDSASANTVLPGESVRVALSGRIANDSLAIPESALTREGFVWHVDDEDRLRQFMAKVLFHRDDYIIIDKPSSESMGIHHPSKWRITTTPLASFLSGNAVKPSIDEKYTSLRR